MRLSNAKRDAILKEESNKKFYDKNLELSNAVMAEVEVEILKTVPKDLIEFKHGNYINTTSSFEFIDSKKRDCRDRVPKWQIDTYYPIPKHNYEHKIPLTKTLERKIKALQKHTNSTSIFKRKLRAVLNGYTTTKKLLEAIPELKDHFKDEVTSQALVPIEQIKEVRKLLR